MPTGTIKLLLRFHDFLEEHCYLGYANSSKRIFYIVFFTIEDYSYAAQNRAVFPAQ